MQSKTLRKNTFLSISQNTQKDSFNNNQRNEKKAACSVQSSLGTIEFRPELQIIPQKVY